MPEATLRAFADHGDVQHALSVAGAASATLRRAHAAGIDLDAITADLEREGVRSFCDSYQELLACIETKLQRVRPFWSWQGRLARERAAPPVQLEGGAAKASARSKQTLGS